MPEEAFQFIDDLVTTYGLHTHMIAGPEAISMPPSIDEDVALCFLLTANASTVGLTSK
jgi:hypothetical protein